MNHTFSKLQARRFLLRKQALLPPYLIPAHDGIDQIFSKLRLIQYDPLNPCGRNVDLVLQSRIADYHPNDYYNWLYTKKMGIECYDKELCIVPIEDFPYIQHHHVRALTYPKHVSFIKKYKQEITNLLTHIEKDGPIASFQIKNKERIISAWSTNATFGRIALEMLWQTGKIVVTKREKGRKHYNLISNTYNSVELFHTKATEHISKEHILRRLNSVGILPKSGTGGGWQGLGHAKDVKKRIDELLQEQILIEVHVVGSKARYLIHKDDVIDLATTAETENSTAVAFIAPLDNLIWDRAMIEDFFDFTYRWEVYTPIAKRKYGYYVLPILFQDTFIGRIEPVLTPENTLLIKGFWPERTPTWTKKEWQALDLGLKKFKTYLKADKIVNAPVPTV